MTPAQRYYRNLRIDASLLRSEGHGSPNRYPIATLTYEAQLARERVNAKLKTEAVLLQGAIFSALSKSAGREFQKTLKKLD